MAKESIKATIVIRGETLTQLCDALARMADEFGGQLVRDASVSASIKLEANDADDLSDAISDVLRAIDVSDGVEANVTAPYTVWNGRRRVAGPTPMEKYIDEVTLSNNRRSVTLTAETARNASEMLRGSAALFEDE